MLKQIKFPPLPKNKPTEKNEELKIKQMAPKLQRIPTQVQTIVVNPLKGLRSISRSGKYQKERPLSSRSVASTRSRDSSFDSEKPERKDEIGTKLLKKNESVLPQITAKSWIVFQMRQGKTVFGKREFKRREIASLTKMMNLITILELLASLKLDPKKIKARATLRSSSVTGTTAELLQNRIYTLSDLFYGMMLPSGNDAATMIAEIGGCLLKFKDNSGLDVKKVEDEEYLSQTIKEGSLIGSYLKEMNKFAKDIGMLDSNFANPHGLSNRASHSTAFDLTKLCTYAMKNPIFRQIVSTRTYEYTFRVPPSHSESDKQNVSPQEENILPEMEKIKNEYQNGQWQNTNKMLGLGWTGIKTGITPNAGPCLAASCLKTIKGKKYEYLVILLSSQSMQARWIEVESLVDWAVGQQKQ